MKLNEISDAVLVWGVPEENSVSDLAGNMIIVPENRPFMYGITYTIEILKKSDIPYCYCTDNMIGILFQKNKISKSIIYYKRNTADSYICSSGTKYIYNLSRFHSVPVCFCLSQMPWLSSINTDASAIFETVVATGKNIICLPADETIPRESKDEL